MKRPSQTHLAAALAASTVATSFALASSSSAADVGGNGGPVHTACHGLAAVLPVTTSKLADANPGKTPCKTESSSVAHLNTNLIIGSVNVTGIEGHTIHGPIGDHPEGAEIASAGVGRVGIDILGLDIVAEQIQSEAATWMEPGCGPITKFGQSRVGRLTIMGQTHTLGTGPASFNVLNLGTLHVNQSVQTENTVTQRSLFLDMPGTFLDLVIAQASAGTSCDGPVTIASVVTPDADPSEKEVERMRKRIEEAVAAEKARQAKEGKQVEAPAADAPAAPAPAPDGDAAPPTAVEPREPQARVEIA